MTHLIKVRLEGQMYIKNIYYLNRAKKAAELGGEKNLEKVCSHTDNVTTTRKGEKLAAGHVTSGQDRCALVAQLRPSIGNISSSNI